MLRNEHPKPQFYRDTWICLNGEWTYTFDFSKTGIERDFQNSTGFENKINVPFCPESKLSGVEYKDFINSMWYQREIEIPSNWKGKRVLLHFGAVDYETEVFIDGKAVGIHEGGSTSFSFDISEFLEGSHNLVVRVCDDTRGRNQPTGKQSHKYASYSCLYTRTTGIWQTVWLEASEMYGLASCRVLSNVDESSFVFMPSFYEDSLENEFCVKIYDENKLLIEKKTTASSSPFSVKIDSPKLWDCENPFLYRIVYETKNREGLVDVVTSYAGLRKVHCENGKYYLNNRPIYLRFVLDQGFYAEGIWTAPSDEALKNDIIISQKAGFNGARLHQKVFEERFHYHADKLGYLTWAEFPNWGGNYNDAITRYRFMNEWSEVVKRDINHPSIITWTPLNETERDDDMRIYHGFVNDLYRLTKGIDSSRPFHDASGWVHSKTDIWSVHAYKQDAKQLYDLLNSGKVFVNCPDLDRGYENQPYILDEFGGTSWVGDKEEGWGYGDMPKSLQDFYARVEALMKTVYTTRYLAGFCYTQLYDVEQEKNGIYTYERKPKFDIKRVQEIFS